MSAISPTKPRRPWHRPHASTWVVMALGLAAMTFWNVAGYYSDAELGVGREQTWTHGWPLVYLKRDTYREPGLYFWPEADWASSIRWRHGSELVEFSAAALAMDALVGLVVVAGMGVAFQWWRRQRACVYQLHLREMMIAVLAASIVLGLGRYALFETQKWERTLREYASGSIRADIAHGTPECLRRFLPGAEYRFGDRVIHVYALSGLRGDELFEVVRFGSLKRLMLKEASGRLDALVGNHRIEALSLNDSSLQAHDWDALAKLPRLNQLSLSLKELSDDQLGNVARIQSLHELQLHDGDIHGHGLAALTALPNLRTLSMRMRDAPPGSTTLIPIGKLKHLRCLTLYDQDWRIMTAKEVSALAELKDLERLEINGYELAADADAAHLVASHPKLRSLGLGIDRLPEPVLASLPNLDQLEQLRIICDDLGAERMSHIAKVRSLRRLVLRGGQSHAFDDDSLAALVTLPHLEVLDISQTAITDAAVESLAAMKRLQIVDLRSSRGVTPGGNFRLSKLRPELEIIDDYPASWIGF